MYVVDAFTKTLMKLICVMTESRQFMGTFFKHFWKKW